MTRRTVVLLVAVVLVGSLALAGSSVAGLADEDDVDGPSPRPPSFYGTVTIDGEPAPQGTELVAVVDGAEAGSIVVGDDGAYGGPSGYAEKLVVNGTAAAENATITFLVNGEEADQTATWNSGETTSLNVTLETSDDDSGLSGIGSGSGSDNDSNGDPENGTDEVADGDTWEGDSNDGNSSANEQPTDRDDGDGRSDGNDIGTGSDDSVPGFGGIAGGIAALCTVLYRARRSTDR